MHETYPDETWTHMREESTPPEAPDPPPSIPAATILRDLCECLSHPHLLPMAMVWLVEQSGHPVSRDLKNAVMRLDQDAAMKLLGGGEVGDG